MLHRKERIPYGLPSLTVTNPLSLPLSPFSWFDGGREEDLQEYTFEYYAPTAQVLCHSSSNHKIIHTTELTSDIVTDGERGEKDHPGKKGTSTLFDQLLGFHELNHFFFFLAHYSISINNWSRTSLFIVNATLIHWLIIGLFLVAWNLIVQQQMEERAKEQMVQIEYCSQNSNRQFTFPNRRVLEYECYWHQ